MGSLMQFKQEYSVVLIAIFLVFVTGCRKVFLSVCSNVTA